MFYSVIDLKPVYKFLEEMQLIKRGTYSQAKL